MRRHYRFVAVCAQPGLTARITRRPSARWRWIPSSNKESDMSRSGKTSSRSVALVASPRRSTRSLPATEIAPKVVPLKPAVGADDSSPPRKRFRTPSRCTMGHVNYEERRGRQSVGRAVPRLRLGGRWLEQFGFSVGDDLQVTAGQGFLLISRRKGGD